MDKKEIPTKSESSEGSEYFGESKLERKFWEALSLSNMYAGKEIRDKLNEKGANGVPLFTETRP